MGKVVVMPKLGLTMTEGTVDEWKKNEGDAANARANAAFNTGTTYN